MKYKLVIQFQKPGKIKKRFDKNNKPYRPCITQLTLYLHLNFEQPCKTQFLIWIMQESFITYTIQSMCPAVSEDLILMNKLKLTCPHLHNLWKFDTGKAKHFLVAYTVDTLIGKVNAWTDAHMLRHAICSDELKLS